MTATRPARPNISLLLALTSLGAVLAPLNSTMIAIALPDIRHEFSLSHGAVVWLVSGYLIAMAVAQPVGGRLGDQIGRERVYRGGLIAFLAFSVAAALAPSFLLLVALRIGQAIAGAVLIPNGMAMLRTQAPPDQLGRLNGINWAVTSTAAAGGPLIGAAALASGSWRLLFPLSIPVVLLALVLLQRLDAVEEERTPRTAIDWTGMALFVALLVVVTLQLSALRAGAGGAAMTARWLAAAAVAAAFVWRQRVTLSPAAEWRLFRVRSFSGATAYILLTNLAMYTTILLIPFFIRDVQGKGSFTSGLLLGAMSVLGACTAPIGGRIADAYGRRLPAQAGAVLMTAGAGGPARRPAQRRLHGLPRGLPGTGRRRRGSGDGGGHDGGHRVGATVAGGLRRRHQLDDALRRQHPGRRRACRRAEGQHSRAR